MAYVKSEGKWKMVVQRSTIIRSERESFVSEPEQNLRLGFLLTVARARVAETRASIESLFENVQNVVPQNIAIFLDRSISK